MKMKQVKKWTFMQIKLVFAKPHKGRETVTIKLLIISSCYPVLPKIFNDVIYSSKCF